MDGLADDVSLPVRLGNGSNMTERSMLTGQNPNVVVKVGHSVHVIGWDADRVQVKANSHSGMKLERRGDEVEARLGHSGEVFVPFGSTIKVYAGHTLEVDKIRGSVSAVGGHDVFLREINLLVNASAGHRLEVDCERLEGKDFKFSAGHDLRFCVRELSSARLQVDDIGGYWEGIIGEGELKIRLKAGGDVTVVTDREVVPQPPHYVLGNIEKPSSDRSAQGERPV